MIDNNNSSIIHSNGSRLEAHTSVVTSVAAALNGRCLYGGDSFFMSLLVCRALKTYRVIGQKYNFVAMQNSEQHLWSTSCISASCRNA